MILEGCTSFRYHAKFYHARKGENMRSRTWLHSYVSGHMEISIMCQQRLGSIIRGEGETGQWASLPRRNSIKVYKVYRQCCIHKWISERVPSTALGIDRPCLHSVSVTKTVVLDPQPLAPQNHGAMMVGLPAIIALGVSRLLLLPEQGVCKGP